MRHSFAPFQADARALLIEGTGVDFMQCDFNNDETWLCVSCRDDEGLLLGVCMFEFKTWFDAYFSTVVRDPRCITRRVLSAMFKAVFSQAVRVTAEIEPGNASAIAQAHRMGFLVEGFKPLAIEGRRDAILFGMTRDNCRFLPTSWRGSQGPRNEIDDGQFAQAY